MEVLEVNENKKKGLLSLLYIRTFDFNYMHVPPERNEF